MKQLDLSRLKIDGGTQPRFEIDESIVAEYADAMNSGDKFPPVVVFNDGANYWLADGFHRTHAARRVDRKKIDAEVRDGTKRDAVLYSVGANHDHGLRRTNVDKRKAVMTLLQDEEWCQWSDREISRHCAVDHTMVGRIRKSLVENTSEKGRTYTNKHGTTSTMNTRNIGKTKQAVEDRIRQIKHLSGQGYRASQIAEKLGISTEYVRGLSHENGIELPDKRIQSQRINARRVVEETVNGLSGYALGLQTINGGLKDIDQADAIQWIESLTDSLKPINRLKKQLQEIANG